MGRTRSKRTNRKLNKRKEKKQIRNSKTPYFTRQKLRFSKLPINSSDSCRSDSDNPLGRLVELINPQEALDRKDEAVTKFLFLGSLDLLPSYCSTKSDDSVGSLRKLCVQTILKQKKLQVVSDEQYFLDEKRRRTSLDDDISAERSTSTSTPSSSSTLDLDGIKDIDEMSDECDDEFSNFEEHVLSLIESESAAMDNDSNNNSLTLNDCVEKILRVGAKISFSNASSVSPEINEMIDLSNQRRLSLQDDSDSSDNESWSKWEDHVQSLLQSSPTNTCSG